jgi:hypothetical protein
MILNIPDSNNIRLTSTATTKFVRGGSQKPLLRYITGGL